MDLGGADEKEPGIKIGLGLFDLFILHWAKHKKPGDIERTLIIRLLLVNKFTHAIHLYIRFITLDNMSLLTEW